MKAYKAVLFDFDYTLADCTDSIVAGFAHAMPLLGHPVPEREAVRRTVGYMLEDAYTMLSGDDKEENRAQFRLHFISVVMERQRRETVLLPGGDELLRSLRDAGIASGIVSSKRGDTIQIILERLGLADCVELVIGSHDVQQHKPHPEGLLKAMERLGLEKEDVLYCGDTVLDAQAARDAGCDFAAVLNGTTPAEAFDCWPHVAIARDLQDLSAQLKIS
jgi:HAD superfamily hydrolase (TIGR01549 family)